ncbi:MAG: mismatch repair protein MutL [Pseudobdellovibrio sp.]|nr:mismatch repair protein MutL [Pseudobdellovibrio sp.]
MANIEVLSSEIVNQIAAGEVVERPAHLVKELLENSLDAGSDQILIEVSEGGRNIRVQDNGSGILSNELEKALQRHATSKIRKTDDLWNLSTFGFRGEALASAAAVSKMTLKSFERSEKKASQIHSKFGVISEVKPSSQSVGTEIKIEELFDNVPARLKFLKSETGEIGQIKSVVKALALANPGVEFKLICNGDLQLFYGKKSSHLERAKDVLEKQNMFEARGSYGTFKCHAVFSSPHEVAKTSKQIWIFAQNRWIQDRSIQAAVMDAFRSLLMHGEFPFAVVWIECDPSEIDVNIHPTKSQVKFQNASGAFKVVQNTLRHALEKAPWIKEGTLTHPTVQSNVEFPGQVEAVLYSSAPVENLRFDDHSFTQTQFKSKTYNPSISDLAEIRIDHSAYQHLTGSQQIPSHSVVQNIAGVSTKAGYWSSLQIIGQAHLTYIVCQKEDRLVFVDQHAAHERVVYESLMKSWREKNFEIQNYLFPLAIDLNEEKVEVLIQNQQGLHELGFEVEQLGPSAIGIKSAPAIIKDSGLPLVFDNMASELLQNGGSFAIEKKVSDLFATMACHSVIRAGQSLSIPEMAELLKSMDQFTLSSFCPHGRPVSVEKTFVELEKLFGRIN